MHCLSASLEDYLSAIYHLSQEHRVARAKDIAERLSVSRASVTGACKALCEKGLVNYAPYGVITLTDAGQAAAVDIQRRHRVLMDFFVNILSVSETEAEAAACRMEHCIPQSIMTRLVEFARFVRACPRTGQQWLEAFEDKSCTESIFGGECERCVESCLEQMGAPPEDARMGVS